MPERYDDYYNRPRSGGSGSAGGSNTGRPASAPIRPSLGNDRPQQRAAQTGASQQRRPAQSGASGMNPSLGYQTRPASYDREYQPKPRPSSSASAQTRRPAQGGYQTRPSQSSPSADRRPASGSTRPQSGSSASGAPRRPAQTAGGTQQRRTSSASSASGVRSSAGYSGGTQRTGGAYHQTAQQTNSSRSSSGYSGSGSSGGGGMSSVTKGILAILCMALLITVCLAVTSKIRAAQPQPGISLTVNTQAPAQPTEQPTIVPAAPTDAPTEAPVQTEAPVYTDAPAQPAEPVRQGTGRSATIRAIGDVIIDQDTLDNCEIGDEVYDFSPLFELTADVMADADWTMINIEGTLRRHSKYGYMGYPQFFTPHSILQDLKEVGVDMLTMCNNHALDGWYDGLKMSLDYADEAGFAHVGAYRSQEEHDTPEIYDIGGIQVGMVNYTQFTNSMESQCDPEAVIYGMRLMRGADYEGDIAALKNAGAEFTIAIMHWGTEYIQEPDADIKDVARRLVAAGADLVIGGHPHVIQPAEYITATQADGTQNTALVIYSLGNFYSEHRKSNTDNGVIFEFTLTENAQGEIEMTDPALIPIYMWYTEDAGAYEFRAVPSGVYLNNPPEGMSGSQHDRLRETWNDTVDLIGGVVEIIAK